MKVVKQTADYTIYQKGSGRYAVKGADKKWINGDDKTRILVDEKLISLSTPKPPPAEEATTEESGSGAEKAES